MTKHIRILASVTVPTAALSLVAGPAAAFVVSVPEPDTLMLLGGGVAIALLARKARGRK
jgi:hypothetical protein